MVLLGAFKSLEIDLSIKGLFKSFDSAHGSFVFVGRSFPLVWGPLKSICEHHFKVRALSNSILLKGQLYFCRSAAIRDVTA